MAGHKSKPAWARHDPLGMRRQPQHRRRLEPSKLRKARDVLTQTDDLEEAFRVYEAYRLGSDKNFFVLGARWGSSTALHAITTELLELPKGGQATFYAVVERVRQRLPDIEKQAREAMHDD